MRAGLKALWVPFQRGACPPLPNRSTWLGPHEKLPAGGVAVSEVRLHLHLPVPQHPAPRFWNTCVDSNALRLNLREQSLELASRDHLSPKVLEPTRLPALQSSLKLNCFLHLCRAGRYRRCWQLPFSSHPPGHPVVTCRSPPASQLARSKNRQGTCERPGSGLALPGDFRCQPPASGGINASC